MKDITTVKLQKKTRDRLALVGNKTETYDDIINKLIDSYLSTGSKKSGRVRK